MANNLSIQAFSNGTILKVWWEWTLVAIICASGLVGIIAFLWTSYNAIRALLIVSVKRHQTLRAS